MTTPKPPKPDLVRFSERILEHWPEGVCDLQEIAFECGLLALVEDPEDPDLYRRVDLRAPQKPPANCFVCPDCGVVVGVDEDLCCRTCGADAIVVVDGKPLAKAAQEEDRNGD